MPRMNNIESTAAPAPQTLTSLELLTVCRLLEGANMPRDLLTKFEILRDYALRHEMETGRAYIALQAS